jgi:hypothetical protein
MRRMPWRGLGCSSRKASEATNFSFFFREFTFYVLRSLGRGDLSPNGRKSSPRLTYS